MKHSYLIPQVYTDPIYSLRKLNSKSKLRATSRLYLKIFQHQESLLQVTYKKFQDIIKIVYISLSSSSFYFLKT